MADAGVGEMRPVVQAHADVDEELLDEVVVVD